LNNFVGLAGPVLNSLNKPQILRNNRIIQLGFFLALIYPFTKFWGNIGVALVMVIFSLVSVIHYAPVLAKEIDKFYYNAFRVLIKIVPSTLIMMAFVYGLKPILPMTLFWLFSLVFLGVIAYFGMIWIIDKDEFRWDIQEGLGAFKEKLGIKK